MDDMNKTIDCLKKHAEESFDFYANKDKWNDADLKSAKEAADLYDTLQTIQMNTGVWEEMKRTGDYSFARYPRISYGHDGTHWDSDRSYARGRDVATGRYMSRADAHYYDERTHGGNWDGRDRSYGRNDMLHDGRHMSTHSVKDQAIQRLEALMDTAESEYERQKVLNMIKMIEHQE